MRIWQRLRYWWDARADEPGHSLPRSPIYEFYAGDYRRYGVVRLLHGIWSFYLRHWQWLWGIVIAIILSVYFEH